MALGAPCEADDRRDCEGDQRHDEDDLGGSHGGAGETAEPERGCDESNDQERDRPAEHDASSTKCLPTGARFANGTTGNWFLRDGWEERILGRGARRGLF